MISTLRRKLHNIYPWMCDKVGRRVRRITLNNIERRRLQNHDFSILSQNCVGSIWYHDLGLKFTSPTINMKFDGNDWVDFLENFDSNVNLPITFISSDKNYPVGLIGGCYRVEFVHYHSEKEVVEKWNERKTRLRPRKAVLAFGDDMDAAHIKKFLSMAQYPNRLLFITDKKYNESHLSQSTCVIRVDDKLGGANLLNFRNLYGSRYYAKFIDYVDFLSNLR